MRYDLIDGGVVGIKNVGQLVGQHLERRRSLTCVRQIERKIHLHVDMMNNGSRMAYSIRSSFNLVVVCLRCLPCREHQGATTTLVLYVSCSSKRYDRRLTNNTILHPKEPMLYKEKADVQQP